MKRENYITWDESHMAMAVVASCRSKDPDTQVGACIVNETNHVVSLGYNGFPTGCCDDLLPWEKEGSYLDTKFPYVCHAELNAILNAQGSVRGCTIYTTLFPCNECAKAIIQSGIKRIVYRGNPDLDKDYTKAALRMFKLASVRTRRLDSKAIIIVELGVAK